MKIIDKDCYVITWDKDYSVYGVKLSKQGSKYKLVEFHKEKGSGLELFINNLNSVNKKLNIPTGKHRFVGGYLERGMCIEFLMPKLPKAALLVAIRTHLIQEVPLSPNSYKWSSFYEEADGMLRVTVYLAQVADLELIFNALGNANIKADNFVSPLFLNSLSSKLGGGIDEEFSYIREGNKLQAQALESGSDSFDEEVLGLFTNLSSEVTGAELYPSLLIGKYYLSGELDKANQSFIALPNNVQKQYFKVLKKVCMLPILFSVFLLLVLFARYAYSGHKRVQAVLHENEAVLEKIQKLKNASKGILKTKRYITLYELDKIPLPSNSFSKILNYIFANLSEDVWIKTISYRDRELELTLNARRKLKTKELVGNKEFTVLPIKDTHFTIDGEVVYETRLKLIYEEGK